MQKKIIDYQDKNKKQANNKLRYLLVGFFILLVSVFSVRYIFASDIELEFDKQTYSVMEGSSTKIGFTIYNNSESKLNLLLWADCDDEDEELSCNYSQRIIMHGNSTQTSSFYVTGREDSSTDLTIYVNELDSDKINEYSVDIDVIDDEEDGEFEIEVYNSSICIGKTNKMTFEINNNASDGLYNLFLTSDRLEINSEYSNPVYLRNEKEIDYYVFVPENTEEGQVFNLRYTIEDNEILETKSISVYARNCPDTFVDFSVTGPTTISYNINKNEEKVVNYTIKNNSNSNKTIYISEEHTEDKIEVNISQRTIVLSPNASKTIDVKIKTTEDIKSGNYDLSLNFFDGINNINKKIKLLVNPEHSIEVETLNGISQTLIIGQNLELLLIIKNKGDIRDEFTVTTTVDNDVKVRTTENSFSVYQNSTVPFSMVLSSGSRTQTGYAYLNVKIQGKDSDFYKEVNYIINVIRDTPVAGLEILSYPREINVVPESNQEVDFILKNITNSKVIIDYIELTDASQEITIIAPRDSVIEPQNTKTIKVKFDIGDIKENQNAKIRFVTRNGGILERQIKFNIDDGQELDSDSKSGITGFLSLKNSIFTGIIVVCLAIILLLVLGIFKTKKI
jgi:hypothetical protein